MTEFQDLENGSTLRKENIDLSKHAISSLFSGQFCFVGTPKQNELNCPCVRNRHLNTGTVPSDILRVGLPQSFADFLQLFPPLRLRLRAVQALPLPLPVSGVAAAAALLGQVDEVDVAALAGRLVNRCQMDAFSYEVQPWCSALFFR
jgi:hypothetical protein